MPRKKTHEEYIKQIKRIKDKPIVCLGIYSGNHVKILHECIRCHHRWEIEPNAVTSAGRGCPKCAKQYRRSHDEYVEELAKINPNVRCLGTYAGALTPVLHCCTIHKHKWIVCPNNLLCAKPSHGGHPSGCLKCGYERAARTKRIKCVGTFLKTTEEYKADLRLLKSSLVCLGEYTGSKNKVLHRCTVCGYRWLVKPNYVLSWIRGMGCPQCASSRGEKELRKELLERKIRFEYEKTFDDGNSENLESCKNIRCLSFDFWLPDFKILIEYQGSQHFVPWYKSKSGKRTLKSIQHRDHIKYLWSKRARQKEAGIRLFCIPFTTTDIRHALNKILRNK